jgi:hypothetical protein
LNSHATSSSIARCFSRSSGAAILEKLTYNHPGALFFIQLLSQVLQLLFKLLPGVFGVQDHDLLIWAGGFRVVPYRVHQVLLDSLELGAALLLDLFRKLA